MNLKEHYKQRLMEVLIDDPIDRTQTNKPGRRPTNPTQIKPPGSGVTPNPKPTYNQPYGNQWYKVVDNPAYPPVISPIGNPNPRTQD